MDKIVAIWDIHWMDIWEKIVEKESDASKIIFIWDYFDSYEFCKSYTVIEIGTQPLMIPTSLISEAMKRDSVLKELLLKKGFEARFHPFFKGVDLNYFINNGSLEAAIGGDLPTISDTTTQWLTLTFHGVADTNVAVPTDEFCLTAAIS